MNFSTYTVRQNVWSGWPVYEIKCLCSRGQRACDSNFIMISSLTSKFQDFKLRVEQFHSKKNSWKAGILTRNFPLVEFALRDHPFKKSANFLLFVTPTIAHRSILIGEGTHTILSAFDYVLWHKQLSDRVLPLTFVLVIYCTNKYNSIWALF